ncbi:MAG TPA: protein kinase [Terriglobales bacterium]|nr:protein kinase [Terriglobales bacterium]
MPKNGPKRLGKYEVLEVVGRGGMGVVYKAVDPEIGRLVGIKMMTSKVISDPGLLKRFYREAQSAGKLQHPNIVTIYDLGVQEATPYLVMEFLEGESLDALIRSGRTLSLEEKLNIVIQVCNALAYAHEQKIVHRDIKPGNVMVLKDGTVKLVDFGIARIGGEHVTRTGQLLGSIQYMSPEQIQDTPVDLRTDIFSTGVLLYQFLTYQLPFEGKDAGETLLKIIHDPPPPLGKFLPSYPPELDGIVQRVLAKNPDDRYPTATELAFDLFHVQERLRRERVSEYLQAVELSVAEAQWARAKEQLTQLLKIDRQNVRASDLLREVQQQIQKQQRSDRIRDLQSQAEQAIAKNALDEALRHLDAAVGLDESNAQLRTLRDSIKDKKERADRLSELLTRAKSAFDTEDLEDALANVKQALAVDADSRDAKELQATIARELAERARQKQVQALLEEARKHISSRHFTAALDVLRQAETLDPNAPGVNEFLALASTGQQQERRRKELEQLSVEIEEALNANDYAVACAKAAEGLERFPNERGLLKLKAIADKEREASEKRMYVERQVSLARRLLEEKKPAEALLPLQEALTRYPDEFVLQSMHSLITESVERERAEQFKTKTIQQAKEAIRRKAYSQAIEILQAAQRQMPSGDFDDLLQFAQEEAATYAIQTKIDAAAKEAHRLMSADEYEPAIELLEAVLKEADDQELRVVLADARRHVEEFNAGLQEAIATARRLLHMERYTEAVKFLEGHAPRYAKSPELSRLLEQVHHEQRRVQSFSVVKEEARDALGNSDFAAARAALDKHRAEFGDGVDAQLLQREIDAKQTEAARGAVAQALQDCRVLLIVRCYQSALDILERVSNTAALLPPEMKQEYDFARATAMAAVERDRLSKERYEMVKQRVAEAADQATLNNSQWVTAPSLTPIPNPGQETELASVSELENVLGEVTLIAEHYPGDRKIQSVVGDVRHQLTMQIAALRQGDVARPVAEPKDQTQVQHVDRRVHEQEAATLLAPQAMDGEPHRAWPLGKSELPAMAAASEPEPTMIAPSGEAVSPVTPAKSEVPLPDTSQEPLKLRIEAQKCLADAQQAFAKSEWEKGSDFLKRAHEMANRDEVIRDRAINILVAASQSALQAHWQSAELLLALTAELYPESPLLPVLKGKIENRKREQIIEQCVTAADAAQSAGHLQDALREVERGLSAYPNTPRLLQLKQDIEARVHQVKERGRQEKEREEVREAERQREIESKRQEEEKRKQEQARAKQTAKRMQETRGRQKKRETPRAAAEANRATQNRQQAEAQRAPEREQEQATPSSDPAASDPFGKETKFFPVEKPATPTRPSLTAHPPVAPAPEKRVEQLRSASRMPSNQTLALVTGALFLVLVAYFVWKITRPLPPSLVSVEINTNPAGASVRVRNTENNCVTPHCALKLAPGQYEIEAQLQGYQTVTRPLSVKAPGKNPIMIAMTPLPTEVSGKPSEPEKPARLDIRGAPAGAEVFLDGKSIGRINRRGTFLADMRAGDHQVKVIAKHREAPLVFRHFPAGGVVELHKADVQFSALPTNTPPGPTAEELDWQKVRVSASTADVEGFLQRYPGGVYRFQAAEKLEDLYWARATNSHSIPAFREYLNRYPGGKYSQSAQQEIAKLDFEAVQTTTDGAALENFLKKYPSGGYHDQAVSRYDDLMWQRSGRGRDLNAVLAYLQKFPNGNHAEDAQKARAQLTRAVEHTPESSQQASAPVVLAIDEKKAVLDVLVLYRRAYEDRNIDELQKIWPSMTHQQVRSVSDFFKTASSVNLSYSVSGEPEITGNEALVTLTQSLTYMVNGKSQQPRPATMTVRLKKPGSTQGSASAWQIESIR